MPGAASFSAASLIDLVAVPAAAGLERRGDERGLNERELIQLAAFHGLRSEARALAPHSRSVYALHASTAPVRQQLQRCAEATVVAIPLIDLLGMRSAVPADWHRLPVTLDTVLWLGATRLADTLSLICGSGSSSPRRQEQLAAIRDLQAALGRLIRLSSQASPSERDTKRASQRADAKFGKATTAIEDDLAAIEAEAAALRARRK